MINPPVSKLILLHCDDELSSEQATRLQRHLEENPEGRENIQQRIEFERQLRVRVAQALEADCPACPASIAMKVRSTLALTDHAQPVNAASQPSNSNHEITSPVATIRKGGSWSSWSSSGSLFGGAQRANVFAVAATLALIAGAVLFGIFGRTIDQVPPAPVDLVAAAAIYADREHEQFSRNAKHVSPNLKHMSASDAEQLCSSWLGLPVHVFDLDAAGYQFIGAGPSDMPVPAKAAHLVYQKTGPGDRRPMLSVFIVPTRSCHGKLCQGVNPGQWYAVEGKPQCVRKVMRSTDGKLAYFIVCCVDRELDAVAGQMKLVAAPSGR